MDIAADRTAVYSSICHHIVRFVRFVFSSLSFASITIWFWAIFSHCPTRKAIFEKGCLVSDLPTSPKKDRKNVQGVGCRVAPCHRSAAPSAPKTIESAVLDASDVGRFGKWFPIPVQEACCYSAAQKSPVACYGNKGDCSLKVKLLRKTSEISQSTCGVRGPKSERHFIAAEIDEFSEYCKRNQQKSQIQSILSATIVGRRTFSPWAARCNNSSWDRGPLFFS